MQSANILALQEQLNHLLHHIQQDLDKVEGLTADGRDWEGISIEFEAIETQLKDAQIKSDVIRSQIELAITEGD